MQVDGHLPLQPQQEGAVIHAESIAARLDSVLDQLRVSLKIPKKFQVIRVQKSRHRTLFPIQGKLPADRDFRIWPQNALLDIKTDLAVGEHV